MRWRGKKVQGFKEQLGGGKLVTEPRKPKVNRIIVHCAIMLEKEVRSIAITEVVEVQHCRILCRLLVQLSTPLGSVVLEANTFHEFKLLVASRNSKIAKHVPDELCPDEPWDVQGESLRNVLFVTPVL